MSSLPERGGSAYKSQRGFLVLFQISQKIRFQDLQIPCKILKKEMDWVETWKIGREKKIDHRYCLKWAARQ